MNIGYELDCDEKGFTLTAVEMREPAWDAIIGQRLIRIDSSRYPEIVELFFDNGGFLHIGLHPEVTPPA